MVKQVDYRGHRDEQNAPNKSAFDLRDYVSIVRSTKNQITFFVSGLLGFSSFLAATDFFCAGSLAVSIADEAAAAAMAALLACCAAPAALLGLPPFFPGAAMGTQTSRAFSKIPFIVPFEDC